MSSITNINMLLHGTNMTRLRNSLAGTSGIAMPFSLGNPCVCGGIGRLFVPVFALADGLSVPTSRGDPPALE